MDNTALNIAIIGSAGSIGSAFIQNLSSFYPDAKICAFSREKLKDEHPNVTYHTIDYSDEKSIENAALTASQNQALDLVIVSTGILHEGAMMPEKSIKELSVEKFQRLFEVNTIVPAMIAKHFIPKLNKKKRSIFTALSARVGSISDNQLGGWYSYRASKSALNMILKNAAIETNRSNKKAIIVGLHPGTVESNLSDPFKKNVPEGKLFTPDYSTQKLLAVLSSLTIEQSGKCFAWDGKEIFP